MSSTPVPATAPEAIYRRAARVVAKAEGMRVGDVLRPRGWDAKRARHRAIYLAATVFDIGARPMARACGCNHFTVQRALASVEDAREKATIDGLIDKLGEQLNAQFA